MNLLPLDPGKQAPQDGPMRAPKPTGQPSSPGENCRTQSFLFVSFSLFVLVFVIDSHYRVCKLSYNKFQQNNIMYNIKLMLLIF